MQISSLRRGALNSPRTVAFDPHVRKWQLSHQTIDVSDLKMTVRDCQLIEYLEVVYPDFIDEIGGLVFHPFDVFLS